MISFILWIFIPALISLSSHDILMENNKACPSKVPRVYRHTSCGLWQRLSLCLHSFTWCHTMSDTIRKFQNLIFFNLLYPSSLISSYKWESLYIVEIKVKLRSSKNIRYIKYVEVQKHRVTSIELWANNRHFARFHKLCPLGSQFFRWRLVSGSLFGMNTCRRELRITKGCVVMTLGALSRWRLAKGRPFGCREATAPSGQELRAILNGDIALGEVPLLSWGNPCMAGGWGFQPEVLPESAEEPSCRAIRWTQHRVHRSKAEVVGHVTTRREQFLHPGKRPRISRKPTIFGKVQQVQWPLDTADKTEKVTRKKSISVPLKLLSRFRSEVYLLT